MKFSFIEKTLTGSAILYAGGNANWYDKLVYPEPRGSAETLIAQEKILGLVIGVDPFLATVRDKIVALAARQRLPTLFQFREHTEAGGLMSYGVDIADAYRQLGVYVARVLKGAKPADLPVLQPTKFEFVINLRTARAFGLAIPASLLSIVDDVVE